ncbi:MAG: hypothetical protein H7287_03260 [Thermoleophilia bacterium]|nr:hypothetical protein [Thermoleophilia bacterium]
MSGYRGGPWSDAEAESLAPRTATVGAVVLAAVCLVLGAIRLDSAAFGTALRARHCAASPLAGLLLLAAAGALLALAAALQVRLTRPTLRMYFDAGALAWALPLPLLLLAVTLPGALGCRAARHFEDLALLGSSLVGMSGVMLAASAAALVGAAVGSAVRPEPTTWMTAGRDDATTTVIEQAIADAHDPHSGRFRGVDG